MVKLYSYISNDDDDDDNGGQTRSSFFIMFIRVICVVVAFVISSSCSSLHRFNVQVTNDKSYATREHFVCVCPEIHHFVSVKLFLVLRCSCICVSI